MSFSNYSIKIRRFLEKFFLSGPDTPTPRQPTSAEEPLEYHVLSAADVLQTWRERIFYAIFLSCLIFASFPYLVSAYHALLDHLWLNLFIYTLSYLSIILVLIRKIPYMVRAMIGLFVFYALGLTALITIGPAGSGRIWLFALSIIATLLIGKEAGLVSLVVNSFTLVGIGFLIRSGHMEWVLDEPAQFQIWVITSVTFIFLNTIVTGSLIVLGRALENNLISSQKNAGSLAKVNRQLRENQEKREKLKAQLIQAQKMESVGRLAGGVAHDYNNISSIIIGYSELALDKIESSSPLYDDLLEILNAGKRSTAITHQLLAFARQQNISPTVLNLNDSIENMLRMLHRLIGEDIDLTWRPCVDIWPVKLDPSQVDQVMANLCVNARDAITDIGSITIETSNIQIDEEYQAEHVDFVPGDYVLLAVTDNGVGMTAETRDKIFDPFYTTKGLGNGTGLGLATVYGIVRQNNGFIHVYSEVDKGTTLKLYFPRETDSAPPLKQEASAEIPPGRGEVVLLVEDDASILKLGAKILKGLGYTVLSTTSPTEAVSIAHERNGVIDLLITDVVMPEMNGKDLSEKIKSISPSLEVLFTSGYTANVIAHRGVLDNDISFLSKPFTKQKMALIIRKILDGRADTGDPGEKDTR